MIRSLRKARGLTLEDVARRIGTEKGYISAIENSKVNPPAPDKVRKLSKVLGGDRVLFLLLATIQKAPMEVREILSSSVRLALERNPSLVPGTGSAKETAQVI